VLHGWQLRSQRRLQERQEQVAAHPGPRWLAPVAPWHAPVSGQGRCRLPTRCKICVWLRRSTTHHSVRAITTPSS
jgi:hypothetical protein